MDVDDVLSIFPKNSTLENLKLIKCVGETAVFESDTWFYKVTVLDSNSPQETFDLLVRDALCEVLRRMGFVWDVQYVSEGEKFRLRVEKRQKLEPLSPADMTIDEALKKSAVIKKKVEKQLEFPRLSAQIYNEFAKTGYYKAVLARSANAGFDDFVLCDDVVVPIGESGSFIALVSHDGMWVDDAVNVVLPVSLSYGDFVFSRYQTFERYAGRAIEKISDSTQMWWLFNESASDLKTVTDHLGEELENMFSENVKILFSKKTSYVKTRDDFGTMDEESLKLLECRAGQTPHKLR